MAQLLDRDLGEDCHIVLVGMHLCGDLSRRLLQIYADRPHLDACMVSPCCLPRLSTPMHKRAPGSESLWNTRDDARALGRDPYELWVERLIEMTPSPMQMTRDTDLLSITNLFLLTVRKPGQG